MDADSHLRTYSAAELERLASQQLQELKKLGHFTTPIDIETIVEKLYGIEIEVQRGLKEQYSIWGFVGVDQDTNEFVIVVDDQLLDLAHLSKIYRMTIAEEFAHICLHGKAIRNVKTPEDFRTLHNHQDWHDHDRNAKRLAAALLIPAENVLKDSRKLYKQMVGIAGYGNPQAIKKHLANELAEKYRVSVAAMKYRLTEWPVNVDDKVDSAMREKLDFLD